MEGELKMKKQLLTALLALALAVGLLQGGALAAQPAGRAGSRLTGADREVYQVLREEAAKIAAGTRSSTVIQIPDLSALSWSLAELGLTEENRQAALSKLDEKFSQTLNMDRVYTALAADCPYELYWRGLQYGWKYDRSVQNGRASIRNLVIQIKTAPDYQGGGDTTVDAQEAARGKQAAETAKAIVERYQDLPDHEKLDAYRREICALVSYNEAAAGGGAPYGDPWQLVYVFDGDPATNVVCEGYSKAFQYLCDLSRFSGDVRCYTVSGQMNGGRHMWNVVRMEDGKNYLVDLTNCDEGTAGAPDKLFLAGARESGSGQSYTAVNGGGAVYTYAQDEKDLFVDGWLALSGEDYRYDPSAQPPANTAFSDVKADAYYAQAVAWAVEARITQGTGPDTFSPEDNCTHAEIVTFLWRAEGEPDSQGWSFIPLSGKEFYAQAVCWAAEQGVIAQGFDPEAECTRAQAMDYIWAAFGRKDAPACAFDDVAQDAPYAGAVAWAVEQEVTTGTTDATFEPDQVCTRGQIATFLHRAYQQGGI